MARILTFVAAALVLGLGLVGCQSNAAVTTPGPDNAWVQLHRWDDQTRYRAVPLGDAFRLDVYYPRVTEALPRSVVSYLHRVIPRIAKKHAKAKGRTIQPIDLQRIKILPGHNPQAGTTNWYASVVVDYREPTPTGAAGGS